MTGRQGVIIPAANVQNLMLKEAVVEAVRAKQFAVYAVADVDQALALLTGLEAGVTDDRGTTRRNPLTERCRNGCGNWKRRVKNCWREANRLEDSRPGPPSVTGTDSDKPGRCTY